MAPLYDSLFSGLNCGQQQRVILQLLGGERGFLSLVCVKRVGLIRQIEGLSLIVLAESLVSVESLVLAWELL